MTAERIKELREQNKLTQAALAKKLGITRSSVNAWEQGIALPSTQCVIALSEIFKVSSDFLLGIQSSKMVDVSGLTDTDIIAVSVMIAHLRKKNTE